MSQEEFAPTRFTDGDWEVNGSSVVASAATFRWLFDCKPMRMTLSVEECEANARLIAASPRMFHLLRRCLEYVDVDMKASAVLTATEVRGVLAGVLGGPPPEAWEGTSVARENRKLKAVLGEMVSAFHELCRQPGAGSTMVGPMKRMNKCANEAMYMGVPADYNHTTTLPDVASLD